MKINSLKGNSSTYIDNADNYTYTIEYMESKQFILSRSAIELFLQCKRCFYLSHIHKIKRPKCLPYTLNNGVDRLVKNEFDVYRMQGSIPPLLRDKGIYAIPYNHEDLEIWRNNFKGISYYHKESNLIIRGAIDDIWRLESGEYTIVDYKATNSQYPFNIHHDIRRAYRNQMEMYQWLFQRNGFNVSKNGYFLVYNADQNQQLFNNTLQFDVEIISYLGNTEWIDQCLLDVRCLLESRDIPDYSEGCDHCAYQQKLYNISNQSTQSQLF